MAKPLAIIADTSGSDLEEFERQTTPRRGHHHRGYGCSVSVNLSHAKLAREPAAPKPAPPAIAPPAVEMPQPESLSGATDVVLIHGNTRDFEAYRIVEDYDALCEALSERVEDLQATRLGVDAAGGFAGGHASTLLCRPQIKGYGPVSLTRMLKATGMVIVLAIDEERFAKVRERLGRRERPFRSLARKLPAPPQDAPPPALTVVHGEQKRGGKYG
jgi:hypothetical protein